MEKKNYESSDRPGLVLERTRFEVWYFWRDLRVRFSSDHEFRHGYRSESSKSSKFGFGKQLQIFLPLLLNKVRSLVFGRFVGSKFGFKIH